MVFRARHNLRTEAGVALLTVYLVSPRQGVYGLPQKGQKQDPTPRRVPLICREAAP